jgi:signal transduction histidine kinase
MSIRTRLTIWYTAVLAAVLILFSLGIYFFMSWQMVQQVDSRLLQASDSVPLLLGNPREAEVVRRDGKAVLSLPRLDAFRASDLYVQLIDKNGAVVAVSPNIVDSSFNDQLDPTAFKQMPKIVDTPAKELYTEAKHAGTPPIRVFTRPVFTGEDKSYVGVVQVGTSLESVKSAQNSLLVALSSLGGLGLAFSAVIGALLARRALRPVDNITKTAMAIYRADNLDQRVAVPKANDEVGRLSQAFNEMLDRLSQLFHAQQRLVADVSHEMRTPLTVIRGNVDLLRAMGCADTESLDALSRESDRMTRLVGDLLLLSQVDAGVLPMHFHPIVLDQLISDVERSGQVLSAGRVRMTAHAETGIAVEADPDRLKQVLLNLVDNAIKHTPDSGDVRLEATRSYNGFVRISVSDTGVGIPEADIPYVFERFYRVDKSRSRANGGSGLGLSIANSIVQAHSGRMVVSSKPGQGTTFDVYLPEHQPSSAPHLPPAHDNGRALPQASVS